MLLNRAAQAHVERIICVATNAASALESTEIADQFSAVWASVGIHPNYAHQASASDWGTIQRLASHPRVCALGETGLDRYWDDCPFDLQMEYFDRHWELGRETGLPLIIHSRDCEDEMLEALTRQSKSGPLRGVMHSFAGTKETALACIELGLYISFSGILTYKKSDALRQLAAILPLDRLLLETDCPYLSPEPHRSKRPNEPAMVVHTAKCLAHAIHISESELSKICRQNANRLFWQ